MFPFKEEDEFFFFFFYWSGTMICEKGASVGTLQCSSCSSGRGPSENSESDDSVSAHDWGQQAVKAGHLKAAQARSYLGVEQCVVWFEGPAASTEELLPNLVSVISFVPAESNVSLKTQLLS